MKKLLLLLIATGVLSACNGSSGENGDAPFNGDNSGSDGDGQRLSLSALLGVCGNTNTAVTDTLTVGDSVCLVANLSDNGNPVDGGEVSFNSDIGELEEVQATTDATGEAEVQLNSTEDDLGTGTVTATFNGIEVDLELSFIEAASPIELTLVASASCESDTTSQNFVSGTSACLKATLTDDGAPISGERVNFISDIGELAASSSLTDGGGVADLQLNTSAEDIGAGTIIATYADMSTELDIEFLAGDNTVTPGLALSTVMQVGGTATNRVNQGQSAQLQVEVRNADGELVTEATPVEFTASRGTLQADSALTTNGVASVTLNVDENTTLGVGVWTAAVTQNEQVAQAQFNYEVRDGSVAEQEDVRLGHFDSNGEFVEGVLGSSIADADANIVIAAGGTVGIRVAAVDSADQPLLNPLSISFNSTCVANDKALLDAQVQTVGGQAFATYEDLSCAGVSGNTDIITAEAVVDNETLTLSRPITIEPESVGAINFLSATPQNIVLAGTGGQNTSTSSVLVFQVNSELGNPLAQQEVSFSLNTDVGGISLSATEGRTNSEGQVSVRVEAGNVPAAVRVTATTLSSEGDTLSTQSTLLSVNTGEPTQRNVSVSVSDLNPEALNIDGQEVVVTARLSDSFNNSVPDGTTVNFTTENGDIDASCSTLDGACSVTWTSAFTRPEDHRVTILAYANGSETLVDSNGNNIYDEDDGSGILANDANGLGATRPNATGFVDYPEAWLDTNEDGVKDPTEPFFDKDLSGSYSVADGCYNGPRSVSGDCTDASSSIDVRQATVIITSSSTVLLTVSDGGDVVASNETAVEQTGTTLPRGESLAFELSYSDTADQSIPSGSTIAITSENGLLAGETEFTMPLSNSAGKRTLDFTLTNNLQALDDPTTATVTTTVTTPSGATTSVIFEVTLE